MVLALHDPGAEIETARLWVRPPRRGDFDGLDEAIRETLPDLVRWLAWAHPDHDRLATRRYLRAARAARASGTAFEFVIEAPAGGRLVGMASLYRVDWIRRSCGMGYWIRRSEWGHGYATEACRALALHAFTRMAMHRLEVHIAPANLASLRVAEKLGFRREGLARGVELVNGMHADHVQLARLRTDS